MRKLVITLLLSISIGGMLSGCASQKEDTMSEAETAETNNQKNAETEKEEELLLGEICGDVESITKDGFVINQTIVDGDTMVTNMEDKTLVTVHLRRKRYMR